MLIQNNSITAGEVVVLKMRDMEGEIIARVVKYVDQIVTVVRPLVAHVTQQQGGIGLAFMPFSLSARDEQEFSFNEAAMTVQPFLARAEVKKAFLEQTTSLLL